jgi:hypothetical protein
MSIVSRVSERPSHLTYQDSVLVRRRELFEHRHIFRAQSFVSGQVAFDDQAN